MQIVSTIGSAPRPRPLQSPKPTKRSPQEWIDVVKQRSTLTGLIEPLGITVGYLSSPLENLQTLAEGGGALFTGDFSSAGEAMETLVDRGFNPEGVGGGIYRSALGIQALTGAAVGGLEIYAGVKDNDKYLVYMGGADLVGAAARAARVADLDGVALGLSLAATLGKTGLVLARPEKYSRVQKVKTLLDAGGSVASSMLKSGMLVGPALAASAVAGVGQMAYMNHSGFRDRVDGWIDKLLPGKGIL